MKRNDAAMRPIESLSESEVIEQIVDSVPAEMRTTVRADLLDMSKVIQSDRPVLGPLLARLAEIRWAQGAEQRDAAVAKANADAARRQKLVRVTVALSPSLEKGVRAMVVRRPGDAGRPILILRESDVTSSDLQIGLAAAAKTIAEFGANPQAEHRRSFRGSASRRGPVASLEKHLGVLRASQRQVIEGLGNLRSLDILTDRYEVAPPK